MNEALTALLLAHAPLTDLVGNRVHWGVQPREVRGLPYLNLSTVSDPRDYHFGGPTCFRLTQIQVDIWAESYGAADDVLAALEGRLSGYRGIAHGIQFFGVFLVAARDLTPPATDGKPQLFRRSVDFNFGWAQEA